MIRLTFSSIICLFAVINLNAQIKPSAKKTTEPSVGVYQTNTPPSDTARKVVASEQLSETAVPDPTNNPNYVDRQLKFEEANFVSGYYQQNGNHSAVTGGIGTEKLADFANTFDLKMSQYLKKGVKQNIGLEIGVDHYTSASSDMITTPAQQAAAWGKGTTTTTNNGGRPPKGGGNNSGASGGGGASVGSVLGITNANSSASAQDTRFYPSVNWSLENEKTGVKIGLSGSYSTEYDYKSKGGSVSFTKTSKDQNREFNAKLQAFFDTWMVIYPFELKPVGYGDGSNWDKKPVDYKPRNSYEGSFSYAQVINPRLQLAILADIAYQQGLLATKYQRVYASDGTVRSETLPDTRLKIPMAVRASYFPLERLILRGYYRLYFDNWGVRANTFNLETPIKITNFISFSPFYRFYSQQQARYFAPYKAHATTDEFYTSDYDLSKFTSQYYGAGVRFSPPEGVWGKKWINMLEIRFGRYRRSDGLHSSNLSFNFKFK